MERLRIRIIILYLYFFSLSIENWSPWGSGTDIFRPSLIVGMLYIIFSFFEISKNFRIINTNKLLRPAIYMWLWLTIVSLTYWFYIPQSGFTINYTLLFCIILFWLISNDLSKYLFLKNHLLIIILLNGILLSMLSYFQIGIDLGHMGRQSLLGNNSNIIGLSSSISIIVILYTIIENPLKYSKCRYILLLILPLLLQTIAKTGSKGSFLVLMVGFIAYFIMLKKSPIFKLPIIIIAVIVFSVAYQYMLQNEILSARWEQFLEDGDTTGRKVRWLFAMSIFLENPICGVGENGLSHLASSIFGDYDPHNVYLYVMATGGLIGIIPMIIFLKRLALCAYKNINKWNSSFPIVLLIILLLSWFKAGGGLNSKLVWAYFALISFTQLQVPKTYPVLILK